MLTVLFLCTGNACRSQMAEGWANALHPNVLKAYSAGVSPHWLDEKAVAVMAEAGVDIAGHRSKDVQELLFIHFDAVVTVCDRATEACPVFPGNTHRIHHGFEDPPKLAEMLPENEKLAPYRRVRDEICAFVKTLPGIIQGEISP